MSYIRGGLGPQGFRGPAGEKGPKGPKGPTGNNGAGDPYWQLNSSSNTLSPINNYSVNKSNIVGLENVDNTSDINKPISTDTQLALNLKINNTDIDYQISSAINNLVLDAESNLNTLKKIANALNNDSDLAKTLTDSIELKAPMNNPTFTGTVTGITSEMVTTNNIVINSSDLDSNGNYILNTNNLKDGCSIISSSIPSTISSPLLGNGLSGDCNEICAVSNSNGSTDIYIGGNFITAYNTETTTIPGTGYICKYNTGTGLYTAVGNGLSSFCYALCAVSNSNGSTDIYIGGVFTTAYNTETTTIPGTGYICKYNTVTGLYTAVGNGLSSVCYALCAVSNSNGSTDIYIGGAFSTAYNTGNTPVSGTSRICKYNTGTGLYTAVRNGLSSNCWVLCAVSNSNDIYIGGGFSTAYNTGTTTIPGTGYICKYNTGTGLYTAVGNGLSSNCYALCAVSNSNGSTDVYIGGQFTTAYNTGTTTIPGTSMICKYNTGTGLYTAVGNGLNNVCDVIYSIPNSTDIYIGGQFTTAYNTGNTTIPGTTFICKYNTVTNSYSSLGGASVNNFCVVIYSIPNSNDIYVGGLFTSIVYLNNSSLTVNRICKLNTNINIIQTYYKNTLISSINYPNPFEVIQKNTISSKEYITLIGNNNTTTNLIF